MRFSTLSTLTTLSLVSIATPLPVETVPGVNVAAPAAEAIPNIIANSWIITYKAGTSAADVSSHKAQIQAALGKGPEAVFSVPGFDAVHVKTDAAGLAKIGKHAAIAQVDHDHVITLSISTNNTKIIPSATGGPIAAYLLQEPYATWGLGRISHYLKGFTNYIFDSSACAGTTAYVLDTGVRLSHTQFGGRAVWGANFIAGSPNTDEFGHGTHVAGTIAGSSVGVCHSARIIAVKVLDKNGSGAWSGLLAGITWAHNHAVANGIVGKSVQSMSIGGPLYTPVNNLVNAVVAQGQAIVVAAGNNYANTALYSPSSAVNAITVGAIDSTNTKPAFSNFGAGVDIFAPGVYVLSSYFSCDTCYYYMDGTSMATPHVSGLVLYYIAKNSITGPTNIVNNLINTSIKNYVINANGSPNRIAYNNDGK